MALLRDIPLLDMHALSGEQPDMHALSGKQDESASSQKKLNFEGPTGSLAKNTQREARVAHLHAASPQQT